ncbi:MAG TPA: three component ABC system middle component [Phnomibacter sp.]|nr:three component ABC system middle component [Phnomibacter sp.]
MKEVYYVYNNEALASCVLLSVINKVGILDIPRCCLVLPFLLDDRTISFVTKNFTNEMTLKKLVEEQPRLFASFNKRYLSLMPVMINSLMILKKGNQISILDQIMSNNGLEVNDLTIGDRFSKIQKAIPHFIAFTENHPTELLYKTLRVQL